MSWQLIQRGTGPTVVVYLCDPSMGAALRAALPGAPIVVTVDSGVSARPADLEAARKLGGSADPRFVLCGYSAGCQGVRALLWAGVDPAGVVVIDGTAAAWPQPSVAQIDVWTQVALQARRGERVMVATCTAQRYTQRLAAGAFASTSTVLARALSIPELASYQAAPHALPSYPGEPVVERHEGELHVYGYPGTDCDKSAHAAQLVHVLPVLLARHVAPLYERDEAHDTDPAPRPGASWADAVLAPAKAIGGTVASVVRRLLSEPPAASELPPHGWRCSVAELVADAIANGAWHPAGDGYEPRPGDLLVSARGTGDPTHGGQGHVERVETSDTRYPLTIGGNEGDTWTRALFDLRASTYRGCIEYPPGLGRRALTATQAELGVGVKETPGPVATKRIQAYHAGSRRGGSHRAGMPGLEHEGVAVLGAHASDEIAWCASGASSCCYEAAAA